MPHERYDMGIFKDLIGWIGLGCPLPSSDPVYDPILVTELWDAVQEETGIKPRESFDASFYLHLGAYKPTDEYINELSSIVKRLSKEHRLHAFCMLHEQGSEYLLHCTIEWC